MRLSAGRLAFFGEEKSEEKAIFNELNNWPLRLSKQDNKLLWYGNSVECSRNLFGAMNSLLIDALVLNLLKAQILS